MSGFSVRIFDDDSNLVYNKSLSVRRVLQRGVFREESGFISLNMNDCGFTYLSNEEGGKWIPTDSTGKIVLVMICREGNYNKTEIGDIIEVEYEQPRGTRKIIASKIVFTYPLASADLTSGQYCTCNTKTSGTRPVTLNPSECCVKALVYNDYADFDFVSCYVEQNPDKVRVSGSIFYDNPNYEDMSLSEAVYLKKFEGNRWLCISPVLCYSSYIGGARWFIRQTEGARGLEYYVLEVEE